MHITPYLRWTSNASHASRIQNAIRKCIGHISPEIGLLTIEMAVRLRLMAQIGFFCSITISCVFFVTAFAGIRVVETTNSNCIVICDSIGVCAFVCWSRITWTWTRVRIQLNDWWILVDVFFPLHIHSNFMPRSERNPLQKYFLFRPAVAKRVPCAMGKNNGRVCDLSFLRSHDGSSSNGSNKKSTFCPCDLLKWNNVHERRELVAGDYNHYLWSCTAVHRADRHTITTCWHLSSRACVCMSVFALLLTHSPHSLLSSRYYTRWMFVRKQVEYRRACSTQCLLKLMYTENMKNNPKRFFHLHDCMAHWHKAEAAPATTTPNIKQNTTTNLTKIFLFNTTNERIVNTHQHDNI